MRSLAIMAACGSSQVAKGTHFRSNVHPGVGLAAYRIIPRARALHWASGLRGRIPTAQRRSHLVLASKAPEAGAVVDSEDKEDAEQKTARQKRWLEANRDVFDKLIGIFTERDREENRKLIAYSKQWATLAEGVFYRLDELSRKAGDPSEQGRLRALRRTLKNIHEEYKRYKALSKKFEQAPDPDWEGLVAQNHEYMQGPFFEYWERSLIDTEKTEEQLEAAAAMLTKVAALVSALEKAAADEESLEDAGGTFNDLLDRINSLDDADKEIDKLQSEGKLDPALMLTMAKAYSGVKESPYVKEEVKDIMAHLYFKAKEAAAKDQPPEVRIIKHLLSMDDPKERMEALEMSFQPGEEQTDGEVDLLHTTPPDLMKYIEGVLFAFQSQKEGKNLLGQTAKLMDPQVITRLRDLQQTINKRYM